MYNLYKHNKLLKEKEEKVKEEERKEKMHKMRQSICFLI